MATGKVIMKQLILFLWGVFLLSLITACTQQAKYQEVRSGLDTLLSQLPQLEDFDVAKVIHDEFSYKAYGTTCYYARAYVIIGSSLAELEAIEVYTKKLKSLGWVPEGKQYETARGLAQGIYDRVIISSNGPDPSIFLEETIDYTQLREIHQSVIFIRMDYMVPSRQEC